MLNDSVIGAVIAGNLTQLWNPLIPADYASFFLKSKERNPWYN